MRYEQFIERVAARAMVPQDEAAILTYATLETLAERITGGEAADVGAQLPGMLQEPLSRTSEPAERFSYDEFVDRVAVRAGVDIALAADGVHAVFATLREAVTGGEFEDVMSQLPRDFRAIVEPVERWMPRG